MLSQHSDIHTQRSFTQLSSNFKTMQTAMNYFLVINIFRHINALTIITYSYRENKLTFLVFQQTFHSCWKNKIY